MQACHLPNGTTASLFHKNMILLRPLAWIYGGIMAVRNKLFDRGILKQTSFGLPVICVGNLAVGGTGKTPHTEYLLRLFAREQLQAAMLSRGYGRKTKGFLKVRGRDAASVGDEPWQVQHSCWQSEVYVCENRCEGIRQILATGKPTDVIVLDDAYQHRYVKPGLTILLTDYSRRYSNDHVMPEGRLREFPSGSARADIVVVTKCPPQLSTKELQSIAQQLQPTRNQSLFFTYVRYGTLRNLFSEGAWLTHGTNEDAPVLHLQHQRVLIVSGIAHPASLIEHFQKKAAAVDVISYPDHYRFCEKDIQQIDSRAQACDIIITTEKDAARLSDYVLPDNIKRKLCVQPIEIAFLNNEANLFNQIILNYVRANKRNSTMD